MIWIIFTKILKDAIQIKKSKEYMMADMLSNKQFNPVVTELFIRVRKLNFSLVFITQPYFDVPKNIRLNSTRFFVMENPKKGSFNNLQLIIHQILTFKTL